MSAPTRAALKAAEAVAELTRDMDGSVTDLEIAEVVDRETGLPALIEALQMYMDRTHNTSASAQARAFRAEREEKARAALQQSGVEQKASAE